MVLAGRKNSKLASCAAVGIPPPLHRSDLIMVRCHEQVSGKSGIVEIAKSRNYNSCGFIPL
jgi:hypothetical protein